MLIPLSAGAESRLCRGIESGAEQNMSWTDERTALLRKLWADGVSTSLIADELGGVTRNAVIGKVHRLGLEERETKVAKKIDRSIKPRRMDGGPQWWT
jgi:hypothetical protein